MVARLPKQLPPALAASYVETGETLVQKSVTDALNGMAVEIGDSKQTDFYPQVKLAKWQNEVNFSARFVDPAAASAAADFSGNVVKYVTTGLEVHLYDLGFEDDAGGFEIEVVLPAKPTSNVFEWTIQHKGLAFYYQPPLTAEELAEGCTRPDNVVGSYAVYHQTARNHRRGSKNYKSGKAFHIYRPKATDSAGKWTWCDLNIDTNSGLMSVTVPQSFLDGATYPVVVDPTFGYTTTPTTGSGSFANRVFVTGDTDNGFALSEAGDVTKLTAYIKTSSGSHNFVPCIYDDSTGPNNLMGYGDTTVLGTTAQWNDLPCSTPISLSSGNYWLGAGAETNCTYYYDTGVGSSHWYFQSSYTPPPPDPFSSSGSNTRLMGCYATYGGGGGGGGNPWNYYTQQH